MHVQLLQSNLSTALKKASRFLSTKPQLPILSCFLFEAVGDEIWITSTDLQMGIRQKIIGTVKEPGSCVIPAKIMTSLVSSLSGNVEMQLNGLALNVKAGSTKSVINTFPTQDFPPFPKSEGSPLNIPMELFQKTVHFVTFAAGRDESRPILTSVLFELAEKSKIVATDGYRLAVYDEKVEVESSADDKTTTLLFSAKAIDEITKVIDSESVKNFELSLSEGNKQAFFALPNVQLVLRTLEGDFPNYQKIMPSSFSLEATVDADEFEHHIKSAMIFSNEGSNIVQIELLADQLVVSARSALLGEYESSLSAKLNILETMKIAFNGRYLLDFLQRFSGKTITLKCNDPLKPAQLFCKDEPSFTYIVMPFRLNG